MHLEHLFTDEEIAIRGTIRKFVKNEILPVREKLEEDHRLVETILQKLVDLGIQKTGYPSEYGGAVEPGDKLPLTALGIISEELARGDAGISLAASINAGFVLIGAILAGNKIVMDTFIPSFCGDKLNYASFAMTDATGGADTENPLLEGRGITTRARLDGDEWVINGTKSWISNAGKASIYLTVCTTDPNLGEKGIALIAVPGDARGLSFGKPETKMGFKTSVNGSIFYEDVRVPKEYRLTEPGKDADLFFAIAAGAQWQTATMSLGIAQAVFDLILDYTRDRKSNGKAVREHGLAAGIMADMALRLEMSRAAIYNYAWMLEHPEVYGPPFTKQMVAKASIVRVYATDAGVWISNKAMELMGSNGLSPEYHLEKYHRDAKVNQLIVGGQQIARYRIARGYYDYGTDSNIGH